MRRRRVLYAQWLSFPRFLFLPSFHLPARDIASSAALASVLSPRTLLGSRKGSVCFGGPSLLQSRLAPPPAFPQAHMSTRDRTSESGGRTAGN